MDKRDWLNLLRSGASAWNKFVQEQRQVAAPLAIDLSGEDLSGMDLRHCELLSANLSGCRLIGVKLQKARFNGSNLSSCIFKPGEGSEWLDIREVTFDSTQLDHAKFEKCRFVGSSIVTCSLEQAEFQSCTFQPNLQFSPQSLKRAKIINTRLPAETNLKMTDVDGMEIDIETLRSASRELADLGMTLGQRGRIVVISDLHSVRREYGGWRGVVHLLSFLAYLAPYIGFLIVMYVRSRIAPGSEAHPTVAWLFVCYVLSYGSSVAGDLQISPWLPLAIGIAAYNAARMRLWIKVKSLEREIEVQHFEPDFSLCSRVPRGERWSMFGLPSSVRVPQQTVLDTGRCTR